MSDQNRLNPMLRFCCAVTSTDPDILAQCNRVDRRRIVRHAVALICTFATAAVLWSAVLNEMIPLWGAIIGGLFAGLIIYLLDLSISTSDWELKGVLREPMTASLSSFNRFVVRNGKLLFRVFLAITLAFVTGTYVTLYWFNETLEEHLHQKRIAVNQPIEKKFQSQREHLRNEIITPVRTDQDGALAERSNLQDLILHSQAVLHGAQQSATQARLDMHREKTGLDRPGGPGPRYHDAKIRLEEANSHTARAEQDIARARSRIAEVEARIDATNTRLQEAEKVFDARIAILAQERNASLMPERSDFLMKFTALKELRADDDYGSTVTYIMILTKATIIIFELIFILILMNDHASIYTLRLIGRTRLEAKKVDTQYAHAINMVGQEKPESILLSGHDHEKSVNSQQSDSESHTPDDVPPTDQPAETQKRNSDRFNEQKLEEPLFDPPSQPIDDGQENEEPESPDPRSYDKEPSSSQDASRHPVIEGEPGEMITVAQALADQNRYWVNPDNPSEIWNKKYRDSILGETE